ncbi:secreted RxLR effector protein 161-like [Elaeis guineensis]|uniref:secreted RxLR effector protein 161-like n=1 Tax=Elaeis guineensis var. tenera TaxID=51953 RepID=UPI003C6D2E81
MDKAKLVRIPLPRHISLSMQQCLQTNEESEYMERVPYANTMGSVMYTMVCCRPDIAHAASLGTQRLGLIFGQHVGLEKNSSKSRRDSDPLEGFVDANYVSNLNTRRSTTGYVFYMNDGPISWRSIFQPIMALSTTEIEYIEIIEAIKKALWLKRLIIEMRVK